MGGLYIADAKEAANLALVRDECLKRNAEPSKADISQVTLAEAMAAVRRVRELDLAERASGQADKPVSLESLGYTKQFGHME